MERTGDDKGNDAYVDRVGSILRETLLRPIGHTSEDLRRPFVAVVHGWNELSPGDYHTRELAYQVKVGIWQSGGTPAELIIPGICGEMKGNSFVRRYCFPYRDFAAAMVEIFLLLHCFDGAVFLSSCDNQVPAYLMGAARADIPSIFVPVGYMRPGWYDGRAITAFDVAKAFGKITSEGGTYEQLQPMIELACRSCGTCPEMGTANTMNAIVEALGMCLPGGSTTAAPDTQTLLRARRSGRQVMTLVQKGIRLSHIIDERSLRNAMRVTLAVGGAPNAVVHLSALSQEVGADIQLDDWDRLSRSTPFICAISPNAPGRTMDDLARAGGIVAVMKELAGMLDLDVLTVTGRSLREELQQVDVKVDREVIRPVDQPFDREGGLAIMKGNLAAEGAILKKSALPPGLNVFEGPARVFDCEEEARQALMNCTIGPGEVVVVRYEGPKGSQGSRELVNFMHALVGMGLGAGTAVITDGRVSGTNLGLVVSNVSPEAFDGSRLAVVRNGDGIRIDVENRQVNLLVGEREVIERLACWSPPKLKVTKGVLAAYSRLVSSLSTGARVF